MIDILIKRLRERANFMSECGGSGLWIKLDEIIALLDEIGRLREQIADAADFDGAAQLIESMAQRVPLSEEQIYQVIEAARESYRAHTTGIRGQMLTIYDDMDWHLVRAVEQVHGIRSEE